MRDRSVVAGPRRGVLVAGFILVLFASLSVHVIMLQVLHIPYPGRLPATGWARLPDRLLAVLGAIALYTMLPDTLRVRPAWQQAGLLFLVTGMIHETVFRLPIMNIAIGSRWTLWPVLDAVPAYATLAVSAAAIVACRRLLGSPLRRLGAALLIVIPVYFVFAPMVRAGFSGVTRWTALREGDTLYTPPYDWHVEVPAYLTFAEPVLAAFLVASLVSGRLPRDRLRAFGVLAALLFALRGQFFSMFTNIWFARTDTLTAMLSFGQFSLESLCLAVVTSATWMLATRAPAG